jgi:peptidoglycan/LPS O-acetylase OafA/YrhL/lysophospholipase L1-like esterase
VSEPRPRLAYVPALDGVRGAGVAGILLFHAGHLPGGWLGVDLFFVLSGFLITSLLRAEFEGAGRISLAGFWARRARRLLPALFLALLGVAAYAALFAAPEALPGLRADGLATLFYVANWRAIYAGNDYWDLFEAPSPLEHTWSLAIEEQFYLFWPLLVVLLLKRFRTSFWSVGVVAALLASASALWMASLYDEALSTGRVYFGTDTRAAATLLGAALAAFVRPGDLRLPARTSMVLDLLALAAIAGLGWAWWRLAGTDPVVYRGGLFAAALAACVVIAVVATAPRSLVSRAFAVAPLRWLGVVSYGVYLWHWPLYLVLTPDRTGLDGWALTAARVAASLGVAALSYRVVERPIRRGALPGGWPAALAFTGAALVAGALVMATPAPPPAAPQLETSQVAETHVLLLGDSLAQALAPALRAEATAQGVGLHSLAFLGCGVLESDRLRAGPPLNKVIDLSHCRALRTRWQEWVLANAPPVVLLIEGFSGVSDRQLVGIWRHACDPVLDATYAAQLERAVEVLGGGGSRVMIVTPPPMSMRDFVQTHKLILDDLEASQRLSDERMACQNAIRQRVAARTGAEILDLEGFVCPEGICRNDPDGRPMRSDGVHFRDEGARVVATWLLDEIVSRTARQP